MEQASTERLALIERLGELVPQLEGRVYRVDSANIRDNYHALSSNPTDTFFIQNILGPYTKNLWIIIQTEELYKTNPNSRVLLETVAQILEAIVNS